MSVGLPVGDDDDDGLKSMALFVLSLLFAGLSSGIESRCVVREPQQVSSPRQHTGDAGFYLEINGQPDFYEERNLYTIALKGDKTQFDQKQFTEFLLVVEHVSEGTDDERGTAEAAPDAAPLTSGDPIDHGTVKAPGERAGSFQLFGDVLTRFSDHCSNTISQTSSVVKSEIQVLWRAPPAGSGCVVFKATVVENTEIWAMDTGRLSLRFCEAEIAEHSEPDDVIEPCCACEEAKYEVTFQGLWSEETHPKDFPISKKWQLHFSDVIGASHSADYRVWEYGGYASKGLEQVAKWGSPRVLESELKSESEHIRTIIKARGLWYPNINGKTFAVFRTDKHNHLVSLVSMVGPSPDWIVGVSGLELCLPNCTWYNTKDLFLYPWDAGVDNGISYESPDSPSNPKLPITRLTSKHPDDPRQPFWNASGAPMKPLAKLTLQRQRLYTKGCGDEPIPFERNGGDGGGDGDPVQQHQMKSVFDSLVVEDDDDVNGDEESACQTHNWSAWSPCSVSCGKGVTVRNRRYMKVNQTMGCDRQLMQKQMCQTKCHHAGKLPTDDDDDSFTPDNVCTTSEWSKWSECSTTCGKGFVSRSRRFFNRMGRKKCPHVETMDKRMCSGVASCPTQEEPNPHCAVTAWSDWSPCSVSCGKGLKVRTRLYMVSPQQQTNAECNLQLMQKATCNGPRLECKFDAKDAKHICRLDKEMGPCRGYFPRWHFNQRTKMCLQFIYGGCRGNRNNFERYEDCMKVCELSHVYDQHVTLHTINTTSSRLNEDIPDMEVIRERVMLMQRKLTNKQKHYESRLQRKQRLIKEERQRQMSHLDCIVTAWSPWSDCSATCTKEGGGGGGAFREKFRMIKRRESGGKKCPKRLRRKQKCRLPVCQNDCILGEWTAWSECSESCGTNGVQERLQKGGGQCGPKVERRMCTLADCPAATLGNV